MKRREWFSGFCMRKGFSLILSFVLLPALWGWHPAPMAEEVAAADTISPDYSDPEYLGRWGSILVDHVTMEDARDGTALRARSETGPSTTTHSGSA